MAKQSLFEYVALYHPKPRKDKDGNEIEENTKIIVEVSRVLAGSDREVGMRVARELPEEYISKLEQVEIIVRSF